MKKLLCCLGVVAVLAALPAGAVDMTRYVALGDSLTAGFSSGGLMNFYQERSYPALLAEQGGAPDFQLPLVSEPGIPALTVLAQLAPGPVLVPAAGQGSPLNATLARPYNDLGVPGSDLYDTLFTTGDITKLLTGNIDPDTLMYDLVLRDGQHTALEQAIGLDPTLVTVWIGNNDILGAAVYGTPVEGVTMTPVATFSQLYQTLAGALAANTSADMVFFDLPNVTAIPFVTTIKPYLTLPDGSHVPLIGSKGPLPEDAFVTLYASGLLAQGIGVPTALGGTGLPLPEDLQITAAGIQPGVVLRADEVAVIQDRVAAFNQIIQENAAAVGAKVLDINGIFSRLAAGDLWVMGGIQLSTDFLTGGVFGYDGVHPNHIGYGLVTTELINLLNQDGRTGEAIPQVDMSRLLYEGSPQLAVASAANVVFSKDSMEQLERCFPLHVRSFVEQRPVLTVPVGRHELSSNLR